MAIDSVLCPGMAVDGVICASIAFPGLFTPQRSQGRLPVDGGLVNPLPVDVARRLGAEFVGTGYLRELPHGLRPIPPVRVGVRTRLPAAVPMLPWKKQSGRKSGLVWSGFTRTG